jgi:hypothetical protein
MNALYLVLLLLSAAMLAFQVTLTRLFALAQGSHLAFMAISLALLGIGASGSYLALRPVPAAWPRWVGRGAVLFSLTLPAAYLAVNYLPFDAYRLAWEPIQLVWLALYYLALTLPFFFGGLVTGLALAAQPERAGRLYGANLLGAGLGTPLALFGLATVGGPGLIFLCTLLGWLAVAASRWLPPADLGLQPDIGPPGPDNVEAAYQTVLSQARPGSLEAAGGEAALSQAAPAIRPISADPLPGEPALSKNGRSDPGSAETRAHNAGSNRLQPAAATFYLLRFTFYTIITLALIYLMLQPPNLFNVRLTPYKSLYQALLYPGSRVLMSRWNAFSRVDVIQSGGIHSAPGLSFAYTGELPPQLGLMVDGDNLAPLTYLPAARSDQNNAANDQLASGTGLPPTEAEIPSERLTFSEYLPLALGFRLRPRARVLILEPGGGLAVLAALQNGAGSVTVVHSNPTVAAAVGGTFADFTGNLYRDPRVTVVIDEPRSFLRRTGQEFDLIIWPLTDSFRPVTAGAYTLNEDYRYTVEALNDALARLSPQGLLLVERWLQQPPSESLRLWATAIEALRRFRMQNAALSESAPVAADHLLALRTLQTSLIGVARAPLSASELELIRDFAIQLQFDLVWLPDLRPDETNRYSVLAEPVHYLTFAGLLTAPDRDIFYADYEYAIAPPTDDQPFFFHFFKWNQIPDILQNLGRTWQPFGGSGYLVLLVLLALATLLSLLLILLPLLARRRANRGPATGRGVRRRVLVYFGLLGLGFLFVEIPLLQRFILYLGQPAYAFAVVVAALLVASGLGSSYLAGRWPLRRVLLLISLLSLLYPLLLPPLFNLTLPLPLAGRVIITVASLFPLGLLLGIPFPRGLALVGPEQTAWAWAINGCASVISAILAAAIALTWGFSAVLWSAALAYALAATATPIPGHKLNLD